MYTLLQTHLTLCESSVGTVLQQAPDPFELFSAAGSGAGVCLEVEEPGTAPDDSPTAPFAAARMGLTDAVTLAVGVFDAAAAAVLGAVRCTVADGTFAAVGAV